MIKSQELKRRSLVKSLTLIFFLLLVVHPKMKSKKTAYNTFTQTEILLCSASISDNKIILNKNIS